MSRPTVVAEGILLRALYQALHGTVVTVDHTSVCTITEHRGLIDGSTTLELDNGITLDGEVIVWHDVGIMTEKCRDTNPVVPNDPMFPYVGKLVANLTLAQIQTLDCGSQRQANYPQQLLYPGARIPTLKEVFEFVSCADPSHRILWNIESKIDARFPNRTAGVQQFVQKQHSIFRDSPYYRSITYQSFDWRTDRKSVV